mmetsp:Transcript_36250/g.112647  ORF Transcript_36250/g.112647 Transcript_36250/m.112647 type:complete len:253 (-) Transcript_36250:475-1233(-)
MQARKAFIVGTGGVALASEAGGGAATAHTRQAYGTTAVCHGRPTRQAGGAQVQQQLQQLQLPQQLQQAYGQYQHQVPMELARSPAHSSAAPMRQPGFALPPTHCPVDAAAQMQQLQAQPRAAGALPHRSAAAEDAMPQKAPRAYAMHGLVPEQPLQAVPLPIGEVRGQRSGALAAAAPSLAAVAVPAQARAGHDVQLQAVLPQQAAQVGAGQLAQPGYGQAGLGGRASQPTMSMTKQLPRRRRGQGRDGPKA